VTAVVFDSSFADARPTATDYWLAMMNNLQSITGIANLNTSEVTSMMGMFAGVPLTDIDLTGFNTSKVTSMFAMFSSCTQLESLDLSSFDTSNVTDMWTMFYRCNALTSLDLSSFNTSNVRNMEEMFYRCKTLTTIYVGEGWSTDAVTDSEDMFGSCTHLVGGAGTTYDADHVDASYAHIDGGPDNPGYLSQPVETYNLWIAGTQVTSANMNNVLGDGTVSYDLSTNTLTLTGANISANSTEGIKAILADFNINLIGNNNVEVVDGVGVSATNRDGGTVTITGGGSLNIKASDVGFATNCNLELQDGAQIRTESTGSFGMEGSKARGARFYPAIKMTGSETILMAKGGTGAITHFRILNLNSGIQILEPAEATFVSTDGIVIDGTPVTNEWVLIASQDYIDGISLTPALSSREGEWYDLQGRKVMNPRKGIYIKDGKKVLIK
jgi:surface protein